jgi:hypothetical protein
MESTDAGWARTLFSETREAAAYWAIMNPELSPPSSTRKAGRPESWGFTSLSILRSDILASSAMAIPKKSQARARGWPWKFPPERNSSDSGKIRGFSVDEFISTRITLST